MQLPTEQNQPTEPVGTYPDDPAVSQDIARAGRDNPAVAPPPLAALDGMLARVRDEVRDQERRRLLFELHDGIGPTLAAVALGLRAAHNAIELNPTVAGRLLGELENEVRRGILELRRLTGGSRPTELDGLGLLTALRRQVATLSGRLAGGIAIELDLPEALPPLTSAVEMAAYRIACEALTNMARHAGARSCTVRLWLAEQLHLEIVDDGIGLPPGEDPIGVGLRSMRERARELGGDCHIETTTSGRGTRVAVRLPLRHRGD